MKKAFALLLTLLGLNANSSCSQELFRNADVEEFAKLTLCPDVQLVDVRTPEEYAEGHLAGAINIDVKDNGFMEQALATLDTAKTVAVYCRSGRRSATAASKLTKEGYKVVNLSGGIMAWTANKMPTTTDTHERDVFLTKSGKSVQFFALMHASIRIVYDGKEIEIDPVSQLGERKVDYSLFPKADYILVTHEHGDHFNQETIATLSKDATRLITNQRCADIMGKGEVMNNGDSLTLDTDMTLQAVPAYNTTKEHLQFHPKGRDNGFVLNIDGLRIYIAGDTEDIPEMDNLSDIDIAFLPCNQPYTMTTGQLVSAARRIRPQVLFPYHYGQTDITPVNKDLQADSIEVRIRHYE